MDDIDKIDHRRNQREEFFKGLQKLTRDNEGEPDERKELYYQLMQASSSWLLNHAIKKSLHEEKGVVLFNERLLPKIIGFTPVEIEQKLLVANFLQWVVNTLSAGAQQDLNRLLLPDQREQFFKEIGFDTPEDD